VKVTAGILIKSAFCSAWFRIRGVKCSLVACDGHIPVLYTGGAIEIGKRLVVRGRIARCELGATGSKALLKIGSGVLINQGATIAATCHIEIGDDTQIGGFAAIFDSDYHRLDPGKPIRSEPVILGSNVWLGHNVIVLPGSKIGDHSVIAAGSIVKGDIPPRVLAAGNPAKVIRELDIPDGWRRG
jgi:acetyltransferase-like isoleucine patch superfamily enzyme